MKFLKGIVVFLLITIIIGGLGYIGWQVFMPNYHLDLGFLGMGNMAGTNTQQSTQTPTGQSSGMAGMQQGQNNTNQNASSNNNQTSGMSDMPGMQQGQNSASQNNVPINSIAVQNKDKLNQAIGTVNQAIDLITIDPYSRITVPSMTNQQGSMQAQPNQSNGTVNVYPGANSTVNVTPPGNNTTNNTTPPANNNMGAMADQQNTNYVFDQGKLQQINTGIYTLAQGVMLINQLSDDLTSQSSMVEVNPPTYQTYISRYNTALQNKTKANNAIMMINQALTLVNVNPYASMNGYQINIPEMQKLHQGVYKLAQGMTMLGRLNDDFLTQMAQAAQQAQILSSTNANNTQVMNMNSSGISFNLTTIFNIVLIVMVVGLVLGVFGAILSMFRRNPKNGNENNSDSEPNPM